MLRMGTARWALYRSVLLLSCTRCYAISSTRMSRLQCLRCLDQISMRPRKPMHPLCWEDSSTANDNSETFVHTASATRHSMRGHRKATVKRKQTPISGRREEMQRDSTGCATSQISKLYPRLKADMQGAQHRKNGLFWTPCCHNAQDC